jgi:hypothetical protein
MHSQAFKANAVLKDGKPECLRIKAQLETMVWLFV